jgi:hypothetical protein
LFGAWHSLYRDNPSHNGLWGTCLLMTFRFIIEQ